MTTLAAPKCAAWLPVYLDSAVQADVADNDVFLSLEGAGLGWVDCYHTPTQALHVHRPTHTHG